MKIVKVRNVKTPERGTNKSAGIDFYIPEDFKEKDFSDFYKKYGKDEATKFLNKYILNA